MTTHFSHDCPYCHSRGAAFEVRYQWGSPRATDYANLLTVCGVCKSGMVVLSYARDENTHADLTSHDYTYPGSKFSIHSTWPRFTGKCPDGVPSNVEGFYNQGLESLSARRWDAAGAMFRKSLDVATKLIAPEKRSKSLYARINELVSDGRLTQSMGEWSHEIRLDGNDAVHDEEPETESDASITQRFTEAMLTYCFTLPAMVEENRAKRIPADADSAASA